MRKENGVAKNYGKPGSSVSEIVQKEKELPATSALMPQTAKVMAPVLR
jgi:hypothetical protein